MSSSTDMMRLESFERLRPEHFDLILRQECRDWEEMLEWDFRLVADSFRSMVGGRLLPGQALMEGDVCRGYLYYLFRENRCAIGGLYFHPEVRDTQWPRLVFEKALRELSRLPAPEAIEGQIVFPGPEKSLEPFLTEKGFTFVPRKFMRLENLEEENVEPPHRDLRLENIGFRHIDSLALLMTHSYRDHVDNQVSSLYSSFRGCHYLLTQLILKEGCGPFDPASSFMAFLRDEPVGAVVVSRISDRCNFISQIFTHPAHQGLGVGRFLLRSTIGAIRTRTPHRHLALTVTCGNERAVRWYERAGFREIIPSYSFVRRFIDAPLLV